MAGSLVRFKPEGGMLRVRWRRICPQIVRTGLRIHVSLLEQEDGEGVVAMECTVVGPDDLHGSFETR